MTANRRINLAEHAILFRITIRQWSGQLMDEELAKSIEAANGSDADSVRTHILMVSKEDRKPIAKIADEARNWIKANTHAWDEGVRIVMATDQERIMSKLDALKADFVIQVRGFLGRMDELERTARRRLGPLFKGFPSRSDLQEKYEFNVRRSLLPSASKDIRLSHCDPRVLADIEQEMRSEHERIISDAMENLVNRIHGVVLNFHDNIQKENKKWHATTITNIHDLLDIVPSLNLAGDPKIAKMCDMIREEMKGYTAESMDTLKTDDKAIKEAVAKSSSLLDKIRKMRVTNNI